MWLNHYGGKDAVGIYQSGYTLVNSYVGMIFTAIAMEYYPRLSSVAGSSMRTEIVVSHEIKTALWVLIPVTLVFIASKELIVSLLYTSEFYRAVPYIGLAIIGVSLRGASWCMAYVILARGDGRIYVLTEVSSAVVYLALNIPLCQHYGYVGLGVAYIAWYAVYTAVCYLVYRLRYGLRLRRGIAPLVLLSVAIASAALCLDKLFGFWAPLVLAIPATVLAYRRIIA